MMKASLPDRGRKHRTESIPQEPYRLVADVDAPLEQNILDLSKRQRIADIHHHHEADHLGRAVEITEGIAHRRRLRILARRLKPIYSDNAVGIVLQTQVEYAQIGSIAAGFARNTDLGWGWLPLIGGAALIIWGGFTAPVRLTQTDAATDYLDASKIGVKEPALEGNRRTHSPAPQVSKAFGRRGET